MSMFKGKRKYGEGGMQGGSNGKGNCDSKFVLVAATFTNPKGHIFVPWGLRMGLRPAQTCCHSSPFHCSLPASFPSLLPSLLPRPPSLPPSILLLSSSGWPGLPPLVFVPIVSFYNTSNVFSTPAPSVGGQGKYPVAAPCAF